MKKKNILGRENNLNQMKTERYNISWHSMNCQQFDMVKAWYREKGIEAGKEG